MVVGVGGEGVVGEGDDGWWRWWQGERVGVGSPVRPCLLLPAVMPHMASGSSRQAG